MKKFLSLLLLLPFCGNLFGQGSGAAQRFYTALLPNPQGNYFASVIPNASVYVCVYNVDDQCTTPIGIYADINLTQPIVQPLLADGSGVYSYYIQSGTQVVEKVCAPYDQCSNYIVEIGDTDSGGGGSGTVTSVSCDPLSPIFTCNVLNPTTTPEIQFTLDTAQSFAILANVHNSTQDPSYDTLIAGTGITFTADTVDTPNTLTISATNNGTVTSVACGNLSPLFTCNVTNPTTTPALAFTLDTAQSFAFLANVTNATGLPAYDTLIAGSNITFTANTGVTPNTLTISAAGGGSGGCSSGGIPTSGGIVTGDSTSTNCGTNNRGSDTASVPATTQTFGYTNLTSNSGQEVVAVGNNNGASNTSSDSVFIGDTNWLNSTTTNPSVTNQNIGIGHNNYNTISGNQVQETVCIGDSNCGNDAFFNVVVAIGENNFNGAAGDSSIDSESQIVAIGLSNALDLAVANPVIAIGDDTCNGDAAGFGGYGDLICLGDSAGSLLRQNVFNVIAIGTSAATQVAASSFDIISIGDGANKQCTGSSGTCAGLSLPFPVTTSDVITIGSLAGSRQQGSEVIAIGDQAIGPPDFLVSPSHGSHFNQGNELVAIGHYALVLNTTGANNVAIGTYAGADGFANPSTVGNSNTTGSNNTWVGYDSGPNTSTQLSNTIAIGYQAHNSASNQTVIGNASITAATIFGTVSVNAGSNIVYRCATAGATLPVGSLTINAAACGTTTDTGLRVQ